VGPSIVSGVRARAGALLGQLQLPQPPRRFAVVRVELQGLREGLPRGVRLPRRELELAAQEVERRRCRLQGEGLVDGSARTVELARHGQVPAPVGQHQGVVRPDFGPRDLGQRGRVAE
jgi:hypothetical protein